MNIAERSIRCSKVVMFCGFLIAMIGISSYFQLGQLQDPNFTIKRALLITPYPGASPEEVELEVSELLENAVQELGQLDKVRSVSKEGLSVIYVEIREEFEAHEIAQIWDEMRRKVANVQPRLPPGAGPTQVRDDFGDVFGILFAVVTDGYSFSELRPYVEDLRRELQTVPEVSRVMVWGEQREVVYVEASQARLAEAGIAPQVIFGTLRDQNVVRSAGTLIAGTEQFVIQPSGEFQSVEEIADLMLQGQAGQLIRLGDIATVTRGYQDPPATLARFNGQPGVVLAISTVEGGNVVRMGKAVQERLQEIMGDLPMGIEVQTITFQGVMVREAVRGFVTNLVAAAVIVIGTLLIFMGLRSGLIIGVSMVVTILATLIYMQIREIDLQRVSLGALIIALGLLIDNAIVITDGILVRRQRGMDSIKAASETVAQTMWPLLGATFVALFAFLPIYISADNTGEYTRSLFQVMASSLLLSWLLAITFTPVLCHLLLKTETGGQQKDPYDTALYRFYQSSLFAVLARRRKTILASLIICVLGFAGLSLVSRELFPDSDRDQFLIDFWLPEGSNIATVSEQVAELERMLLEDERTASVASFIGSGPPRFVLSLDSELANSSYALLTVTVKEVADIPPMIVEYNRRVAEAFPNGEPRIRAFPMGAGVRFDLEAHFHGPDPAVLRSLSEQAQEILRNEPTAHAIRDNWRQPRMVIAPQFDQDRARRVMVRRSDVADSLRAAFDGLPVGLYREGDLLMPIMVRMPEVERRNLDNISQTRIWSGATGQGFPLMQVAHGIDLEWRDSQIWRENRQRRLTVEADSVPGVSALDFQSRVHAQIEAIPLPPGYSFSWGGVFDASRNAQAGLAEGIPISFLLMILTVVVLFNAFRPTFIIFVVLPLAIVGVAAGLLVTGLPFSFMAILGTLSLSGMLIKNSVVLLDQTELEIAAGKPRFKAVKDSSISRMRPILMAALTTILGMIPLAFDPFFNGLAVAMMAGLLFATVITLYLVPVLYIELHRIREDEE